VLRARRWGKISGARGAPSKPLHPSGRIGFPSCRVDPCVLLGLTLPSRLGLTKRSTMFTHERKQALMQGPAHQRATLPKAPTGSTGLDEGAESISTIGELLADASDAIERACREVALMDIEMPHQAPRAAATGSPVT